MTTEANPVLWLEQAMAEDPGEPCPPLAGAVTADVCVVGGGLAGLWTALEAREQGASVVLVEAEAVGFGASGRNGGWMTSWWDEVDNLEHRFGAEHARWLAQQSSATIDRIQEVTEAEGIDCGLRRGGSLIVATAPAQVERLPRTGEGPVHTVAPDDVRRRTGTPVGVAAVEVTDSAAVHPARLVRGLRRLALRRGVRIFEGTAMRELQRGTPPRVITSAGRVEAGAVAVALGAWSARLTEARRAVVPVASHIVATEPIPERLRELGWTGGELLGDPRVLVHYAQASPDGRVVFGRGGGTFGSAGRVTGRHYADPAASKEVEAGLRRWFPDLTDVAITHRWGGPVDHTPGHLPWVAQIGDAVHYAAGFSGNGVAPSALLGRILARRALRIDDELTRSGLVGDPPGLLPPEPLRSAGGRIVRSAVRRAEAAEEEGRTPDPVTDRLRRLVWFTVPPALDPRAARRHR